jgi:hypothetical protein
MIQIFASAFQSLQMLLLKLTVHHATVQGGALNRGLLFVDPPPSLLGAVSGNISEIR